MTEVPPRLQVTSRSGRVRVTAAYGSTLEIEGADIEEQVDGSMQVRALSGSKTVEVRCATGTDVSIGTASGRIETVGPLGEVRAASKSGKIIIDRAALVDARTSSGSVRVGDCEGECRVVVASGKVSIGRAGKVAVAAVSGTVEADDVHDAEIKTVSGKITVGARGGGDLRVKSVSGTVEVVVPAASTPATALKSLSGRIRCECAPGTDGEIKIATVSGSIRVTCR